MRTIRPVNTCGAMWAAAAWSPYGYPSLTDAANHTLKHKNLTLTNITNDNARHFMPIKMLLDIKQN